MFYVYMIKNTNNDLYIGVTDNPNRRLLEHNSKRGALFTKKRDDFAIIFLEKYETLQSARKREIQLKKWRRSKKETLIERYLLGLETKLDI